MLSKDCTPDRWVMIKINHTSENIYKILASWYGGYTQGDIWRMNSSVVNVEEDGDFYNFYGFSGSVYRCHKNAYGMTAYASSILEKFQDRAKTEMYSMELLDESTNFMELDYQ